MNFSDVGGDSNSQGIGSASSKTGITSLGTSTVYTLIETSHPVFGKVKRLWNSPMESHREVRNVSMVFFFGAEIIVFIILCVYADLCSIGSSI